jgi:EmrB/QacA subfamily drug resistance transporter
VEHFVITISRFAWTFAITSSAWFVFALDRLVVATALPAISADLGADLAGAEWTVNAYTLSFAVLLLAGAALGDRFGRRRMFAIGMALFSVGSAAAALAPTTATLVAARAVQGAGGAMFAPVSLTLLSAATPAARRGAVFGAWGGIGGVGAAVGPLLGGGLTGWAGWQWIFWANVPLGLVLVLLGRLCLGESRGPHGRLDVRGVALSGAGMLGVVWAVIRAGSDSWARPDVLVVLIVGVLALALFVAWEMRAPAPLLPMRFFRSRAFAVANVAALLMYAALFGALFLVAQLLQTGLGASPFEAGLRMLPMVAMPMLLAPAGGALSDRWGTRRLMVLGVSVVSAGLAWLAAVTSADVAYVLLVPAMIMMGGGSALFFAPVAATVLGAVAPNEQGQASGVATVVREIAVVLGVAALAAVFAAHGDLDSPGRFLAGVVPALWLAAALASAGVLAALALPRTRIAQPRALVGTQVDVPRRQPARTHDRVESAPAELMTGAQMLTFDRNRTAPSTFVRHAWTAEHREIRELVRTAYGQYTGDIPPEVWGRYLADLLDLDRHARHGELLVGVVGSKIAGYAAFYPDASTQGFGWPSSWAGGRGLAVHPAYRGHGVGGALLGALERRARVACAPAFAFHTSEFMTTAVALYERMGYRRAPEFDLDVNAHYGVAASRPWTAVAYLKCLSARPAADAA